MFGCRSRELTDEEKKMPCRYGLRCKYQNECQYNHSPAVMTTKCKHNLNCLNPKCPWEHTGGFCEKGLICPDPRSCKGRHMDSHETMKKSIPCKSEVWTLPEDITICYFGHNCTKGDKCDKTHMSLHEMVENGWIQYNQYPICGGWYDPINPCVFWHSIESYNLETPM